jgi:hypothetical protein
VKINPRLAWFGLGILTFGAMVNAEGFTPSGRMDLHFGVEGVPPSHNPAPAPGGAFLQGFPGGFGFGGIGTDDILLFENSDTPQEFITANIGGDLPLRPKSVRVEDLLRDLGATKQSLTPEALVFKTPEGWEARAELSGGYVRRIGFMYGYSKEFSARRKRDSFLKTLTEKHLKARYLSPNPFYKNELAAEKKLRAIGEAKATVTKLSIDDVMGKLDGQKDSYTLVLDLHGHQEPIAMLNRLIHNPKIDWVGMEMLPTGMQPTLNQYFESKPGTSDFEKNRAKLVKYFSRHWDDKFEGIKDPELNPYFLAIELAKKNGKRVYGMDISSEYFNSHEVAAPLTVATRNQVWASAVPVQGNGVVFGGMAHFEGSPGIPTTPGAYVQDFLAERNPSAPLFMLNASDEKSEP